MIILKTALIFKRPCFPLSLGERVIKGFLITCFLFFSAFSLFTLTMGRCDKVWGEGPDQIPIVLRVDRIPSHLFFLGGRFVGTNFRHLSKFCQN